MGPDAVVITDGGDFLSFARIGLASPMMLDPGPFGCIGIRVPYGISASLVFQDRPVIVATGGSTRSRLPRLPNPLDGLDSCGPTVLGPGARHVRRWRDYSVQAWRTSIPGVPHSVGQCWPCPRTATVAMPTSPFQSTTSKLRHAPTRHHAAQLRPIGGLAFASNFGAGQHQVSVAFTNDAHGGSAASDRNPGWIHDQGSPGP
jgi:hypothetical protein